MDLNERETLVKVQQQLENSIENQSQITEDMREIFFRIDRDSKSLESLKSDVRSHIETTSIKLDTMFSKISDVTKMFEKLEKRIETTESKSDASDTTIDNKITLLKSEVQKSILEEKDSREKFERKQISFNSGLKVILRNALLIISGAATLLSLLSPYIVLLIKKMTGN